MTHLASFTIMPHDTLMFRDGRPFNQNDPGASVATSVFPPFPPTIVGAIRMGLWQMLGGDFPKDRLGNGTNWQKDNVLGPLRFGPVRLRRDKQDYVPAPLHLIRHPKDGDRPARLDTLRIGKPLLTDLGEIDFPEMPEVPNGAARPDQLENHWISTTGLAAMQRGETPDLGDVLPSKKLFAVENRVGIGIDEKTGVAADGQLYMASHIRLRGEVELVVDVNGLADEFSDPIAFDVALGGEGRAARFTADSATTTPDEINISGDHFALALLSPADLPKELWAPGGEILAGFELVTVCAGKPVVAGGWNALGHHPIPLRQLLPAGSVLFFKRNGKSSAHIPNVIGRATEWGFGHCCVLPWPKGDK